MRTFDQVITEVSTAIRLQQLYDMALDSIPAGIPRPSKKEFMMFLEAESLKQRAMALLINALGAQIGGITVISLDPEHSAVPIDPIVRFH